MGFKRLTTYPRTSLEHYNERCDGVPKPSWELQPTASNLHAQSPYEKLNEGCWQHRHLTQHVRAKFYVITEVTMRTTIFWEVTPCSLTSIWAISTKQHDVTYRQAAIFVPMFLKKQVLLGWRSVDWQRVRHSGETGVLTQSCYGTSVTVYQSIWRHIQRNSTPPSENRNSLIIGTIFLIPTLSTRACTRKCNKHNVITESNR